jgi:hypothetical protein
VLGAELEWDGAQQTRQVYAHRAAVEDERGAPIATLMPAQRPGSLRQGIG